MTNPFEYVTQMKGTYKVLSAEESRHYVAMMRYHRSRNHKKRALHYQNLLVDGYTRLVMKNTTRYFRYKPSWLQNKFEDVFQEGIIGLIQGIISYDPSRGACLSTWAGRWIYTRTNRFFHRNKKMVKIPDHIVSASYNLKKLIKARKKDNPLYSFIDAAEELGTDIASLDCLVQNELFTDSTVDEPTVGTVRSNTRPGYLGKGLRGLVKKRHLIADEAQSGEAVLDRKMTRETIFKALDSLPKKYKEIIVRRMGLNGDDPESFSSIGRRLKITKERVRQLEFKAIERLRADFPTLKELF